VRVAGLGGTFAPTWFETPAAKLPHLRPSDDKRRHFVEHAGHLWEVDEFLGDNAGLVVAEIELEGADEAFAKPEWLGVEATDASRYYNLALASRPYSQWREDEREAIDLRD